MARAHDFYVSATVGIRSVNDTAQLRYSRPGARRSVTVYRVIGDGVTDNDTALHHAVRLMRDALVLLDATGEGDVAQRVQWAIDVAERVRPWDGREFGETPGG
jgi:hypothetical protein